jgi:hypothetical protein
LFDAAMLNEPVNPCNPRTGSPPPNTATSTPVVNSTRTPHVPVKGGARWARNVEPDVALVSAALPSAAKYPGTSVATPLSWVNTTVNL